MKVMFVICVATMLGIETTSFIVILIAAGLAISIALQGCLSNFAGGVMIIIFRPFKVGDYIEAHGESVIVIEMGIFLTILETFNRRVIIIPNGPLSNSNLVNYTAT